LEVAPLGAVLVGPGTPGLGYVVLGVECSVVVAEALVLGLSRGGAGEDLGGVDVVDEVEHFGGEVCGFFGIVTGGNEGFDGGGLGGGGGGVEGGCGDVVAIFIEGRVVDCRVPVAALPATDSIAKDIGKVIVVSEG